ncbi:glycosyltransferase family 39 protein [Pseudomonas rhodesiae]|uniref:glycosyltransferase family 39 protein n=1 Tax=Pseudomonas rhodesiae TaxID=76760 RepID=UPI0028AFF717|nr:glycosyltransferase family 39 protein [Pseudomonas rhodesiae]
MFSDYLKNKHKTIVLGGCVLLVGAWVRLHDIDKSGIWTDEAFSLILSAKSLPDILYHTARDVHPPLFYLILHGWMLLFGDGVHTARLLSVIFGIVNVVLAMWLMRLLAGWRAMMLGGLLVALLPMAVRYSQEVRMYVLYATFMLGAMIALVMWLEQPHRRRWLIAYCLLMVAGLYTHYFTVTCAFAHWLYLAFLTSTQPKGERCLMRPSWWVANAAIALIFIPWLPSLIQQMKYSGFDWIPASEIKTIFGVFWQFLNANEGTGYAPVTFYSLAVLLMLMSVFIVIEGNRLGKKYALLVTMAWGPIGLIIVVSIFKPLFVYRYFQMCAFAYSMIAAAVLDRLLERSYFVFLTVLALVAYIQIDGLSVVYAKNPQNLQEFNQFNRLASEVKSHSVSQDGLLVMNFFLQLPMVYYFRGDTLPMSYWPLNSDGTSSRPDGYQVWTLLSEHADRVYVERLESLTTGSGRVWLMDGVWGGSSTHKLPDRWQLLQTLTVGAAKAELFVIRQQDAPVQKTVGSP